MRNIFNLNNHWLFKDSFSPEDVQACDSSEYQQINLPHIVKELPYNCFGQTECAMCSTYLKRLRLPEEYRGKRSILEFNGVMAQYQLYVNGQFVQSHKGGYSRSRVEVSSYLHSGENTILLMVDSHEDKDIPPFGKPIDFLTYGGIYRDVNLILADTAWMEDVLFRYVLEENTVVLKPEIHFDNAGEAFDGEMIVLLKGEDGVCAKQYSRTVTIPSGRQILSPEPEKMAAPALWDIDHPYLYTVEMRLIKDGVEMDEVEFKTGFRTIACRPEGFYLNGRQVKLVGLNRHQDYPYVGYAMPKRVQQRDAQILYSELHVNTVRTSHYIQSEDFIAECDKLGLLVVSEIPGWGVIGGDEFKRVSHQDIRDMITVQYNHPSIFIWSIRINESDDCDEFYAESNAIAKGLDPDRPTTGVRCITGSKLLEDVYTFNDFIHFNHLLRNDKEVVLQAQQAVTGLQYKVPYLVSEFCGHIYPTRPTDGVQRQTQHALIHASVQGKSLERKDAMGAIGWCAFDYHTHGDNGSGDKICYHGVMSAFRTPKYAAHFYRSQVDPKTEIVLEPATLLARGEPDDGMVIPFVVFTNCDYIEVELYGKNIGRFYPSLNYGGLKHPPVIVDNNPGTWRDTWLAGTVIGFIGGTEVARRTYSPDAYLQDLEVRPDDLELHTTVTDATRIVCRFCDQLGNALPLYNGILQIETAGDVAVIGPTTVATVGGSIAFWVQTRPSAHTGEASVTITAANTNIPAKIVRLALSPDPMTQTLD